MKAKAEPFAWNPSTKTGIRPTLRLLRRCAFALKLLPRLLFCDAVEILTSAQKEFFADGGG